MQEIAYDCEKVIGAVKQWVARTIRSNGMNIVRLSKTSLVFCVGLYGVLVAANNILDYGSNFEFVQHVMLMDTTFPGNNLMWRAISNAIAHHIVYVLIIAGEMLAGVLCLIGTVKLARNNGQSQVQFRRSKRTAIAGLTLGIIIWFFGFLTVAGEWFLMWQSQQWNGSQSAFRTIVCISAILIYLNQDDPDPD